MFRRGFLCHAMFDLCFDEEGEDDLTVMTPTPNEDFTHATSLQGTALEDWQRQKKREKRAMLGLSFSDDPGDGVVCQKKNSSPRQLPANSIAKSKGIPRGIERAPQTIMVSKTIAADKYSDPTYPIEDDVASEVSWDASAEPEKQQIKGQRIQIKRKPPKVIQAKEKHSVKKEMGSNRTLTSKKSARTAGSKMKSLAKRIFGSEKAATKPSTKQEQKDTVEIKSLSAKALSAKSEPEKSGPEPTKQEQKAKVEPKELSVKPGPEKWRPNPTKQEQRANVKTRALLTKSEPKRAQKSLDAKATTRELRTTLKL
ncbi:MAG: hypothetical protein SGILL_006161, partial [Bacillariaceae sp.]